MTESQAMREAFKRWDGDAFARHVSLAPDAEFFAVGRDKKLCGIGKTWEQAFQDAEASENC